MTPERKEELRAMAARLVPGTVFRNAAGVAESSRVVTELLDEVDVLERLVRRGRHWLTVVELPDDERAALTRILSRKTVQP